MDLSKSEHIEWSRVKSEDVKEVAWFQTQDSTPGSTSISPSVSVFGSSRSTSPTSFGTSPPTSYSGSHFGDECRFGSKQLKDSTLVASINEYNTSHGQWLQPLRSSRPKDLLKRRLSYIRPRRTPYSTDQILFTDSALDEGPSVNEIEPQHYLQTNCRHVESPQAIRVCFTADDVHCEFEDSASIPFVDPFTGHQVFDDRRPSASSSASAYLRPNAFAGHRDTFARIDPSYALVPTKAGTELVEFSQISVPHNNLPISTCLPAEILHQIFQYLNPCDFDAARHICRSWYLASLDRAITHRVMKQAGCYPAFLADIEYRRQLLHTQHLRRILSKSGDYGDDNWEDEDNDENEDFGEEWIASKRLATECRLSAAWHKSGLSRAGGHSTARLVVTKTVQFDKLAYSSVSCGAKSKRFTVSGCGKFVLVIAGTDVFVYRLTVESSTMIPCVRLVTGKEVLSVSMDTSSGRYAVAALLAGRVGVYWDIDDVLTESVATPYRDNLTSLGSQTDHCGSAPEHAPPIISCKLTDRRGETNINLDGDKTDNCLSGSLVSSTLFASLAQCSSPESLQSSPDDLKSLQPAMPIKTKPTKIYTNLGSANDEPRSVAICPQRKCVAFGCRTGIELYWTDGLTGRNLNRWFPLAAPSDHLYFLPRRPEIDSAKKLRLISSATRPTRRVSNRHNSSPSIVRFSHSGPRYGRQQSMTRLFFGDLPFPPAFNRRASRPVNINEQESEGVLRAVDCDHFNAIPLSDGVHMLYTEPESGLLCLGSDAPLGGPTKLVRKVCMVPPSSDQIRVGSLSCYVAGHDLNWGVRVVAAYDDGSVFLYNIPSDCFERIRHVRSTLDVWDELSGVVGQSDLLMDALINRNNLNDTVSTDDVPNPGSRSSFRSLQIQGAFICKVDSDVEAVQVDCSGGGLRVWIFNHNGVARRMDIYAPRHHRVERSAVGVDGMLYGEDESAFSGRSNLSLLDDQRSEGQSSKYHVKFMGLDGACDIDNFDLPCHYSNFEHDLELIEDLNTHSMEAFPDEVPSEEARLVMDRNASRLQIEILTDFRNLMLPSPYVFSLD